MRSVRAAVLAACGAAILLTGCGPGLPSYIRARDHWTEHENIYEDFESRLFLKATYKTEDFRREYVKEYADVFQLDDARQAALLESELAEASEVHVVMVAMFTHDINWDDLDPRRGIWEVRLEGEDGRFVLPADVNRLDVTNPTWKRLFPYIGDHDSFWEVKFPKSPDDAPLAASGQALHLVIAGAPARARVSWTLP